MNRLGVDAESEASKLLENLLADARGNTQRRLTLERLAGACDALIVRGVPFSLRDIEAYCKETFKSGPNAQTISNDRAMRAYVHSRQRDVAIRSLSKSRSRLDAEIEDIDDIDLRVRLQVLVEEHRLLSKRHRIMVEALAKLSPPIDLDQLFNRGHTQVMLGKAPVSIARDHVSALKRFVSTLRNPAVLSRCGLKLESGDIVGGGFRETLVTGEDLDKLEEFTELLGDNG